MDLSISTVKIIDGTGNTDLVTKICGILNLTLTKANISQFNDGETCVEIFENMRGKDVFVIQSVSTPINDNLMKLLFILDALKRSSAARINVVCPYLAYSRQDRKAGPRTPISARLIADMITTAGADRILTVDLHAEQIQGFYSIPMDNMYGSIVFKKYLESIVTKDTVIVSPDVGGVKRARLYGQHFDFPIVIVEKRRPKAGECEIMNIIGDVSGKECIIVDDMIDSGGTVCNCASVLKEMGALTLTILITHGVLSGKAVSRLEDSEFDKIVVSDTINNKEKFEGSSKFVVVSFDDLIAKSIYRIHNNRSVSELFL